MRGPSTPVAGLVFAALALAATWPLALQASTHCWGARYDLWANLWLMDYFHRAFTHGPLTLATPDTFYPEGFSVWAYGHFLLQILVSPLLALVGPPLAYAVLVWVALAGSALALHALALDRTRCRWAALVAGALYSFHGLAYAELAVGSVEQAATFGLPLYALCLVRWTEGAGARWGVLAWLAMMLTAFSNWFFGIALAVFTALYALFHAVRRTPAGLRFDAVLVARVLVLGVACGACAAPFVARVVPQTLERPPLPPTPIGVEQNVDLEVGDTEPGDAMSPRLSQVSLDNARQSAVRQTVTDSFSVAGLFAEELGGRPRAAGPGFQIVLFAVLALALAGPRARFWFFAWAVLTLISMGPFLRWTDLGTPTSFRLPYHDLYNALPLFRVAYRPYRFGSVALMAGGVLVALAVAALLQKVPGPRRRALVAVSLLAVGLAVRWFLCSPERQPLLSDARVPAFYEELGREPERAPLIEIPLHHWAFGDSNARFQYYQTVHRQPMLNNSNFINLGQMMRLHRLARAHPLLFTLAEGPFQRVVAIPATLEADLQWLRQAGFRYLVVHTSFPEDVLHLTGYQEDKEIVGEAFVDFLTSLFGAPRQVEGALLFDVRRSGDRAWRPAPLVLDFPGDYLRTRVPCEPGAGPALRWELPGTPVRRLVFWARPEPGTSALTVRSTSADGGGSRRRVELPRGSWTRVVVDLSSAGALTSVELEPQAPGDRVALAGVQLAR